MSKISSALASAALTVSAMAVAFLLFEVACRIIVDDGMHYHLEMWKYAVDVKEVADNPAVGHRHKPNAAAHLMGVDVAINRAGLRDDPVDMREETLRVLMLGDSITFGWGVPQDETVSARLQRNLSLELNRTVDVVNAGVGNYNTAMEVAWFEDEGLGLDPDLVVLNLFINDAEPTPRHEPVRWWDRLFYSRVILFGGLDTVERSLFGGADWKAYYRNLYQDDVSGWVAMQNAVAHLAELCRDRDIPLVLVDYPEMRELSPYPFTDVVARYQTLASENDVPFVSLLPAIESEVPADLWVTPPDPHPNSYAAGLMADALSSALLNLQVGLRDIDHTGNGLATP